MADLPTSKGSVPSPRRGAARCRLQSIERWTVTQESPGAAEETQTSPDVFSSDQASQGYLQRRHTEIFGFSADEEEEELTDSSPPRLDQELLMEPREQPGSTGHLEGWQSTWHRNQVVALSGLRFDSLLREFPEFHSCKGHMAAFVLQREVLDTAGGRCQHYAVVALGSGVSAVDQWLCYSGLMVQDCGAVAIARRALQRYLYKQLLVFYDADPKARDSSIFERSGSGAPLRLRPDVHLHLFCKQPLDAGAKDFSYQGPWAQKLHYHSRGLQVPASCLEPSVWGSRVCCVSPSAKLFRWAAIGLQGALLSHLIQPVYIDTLVLGSKAEVAEEVSEWINPRLGEDWQQQLPTPYRRRDILVLSVDCPVPVLPLSPKQDLSLNWCLGDPDVEVLDEAGGFIIDGSPSLSGPGYSSRLCKRALYTYFVRVLRRAAGRADSRAAGHAHLLEQPTYRDVKAEAHLYQRAKSVISQLFLLNQVGPWNCKHLVDCFSL